MLIEFRVANFRSIREEQVLSMVASKADKTLPENVIDRDILGLKKGERFLKAAAIYGANASGKSNVLQAMEFMRRFVVDSAARMTQGDPIPVEPFKLDEVSRTKPSTFEMTIAIEGVMYVFGFSATRERVVKEYLHAYPKWKVSGKNFRLDESLKDKVRDNSLLLSVGAAFNHEATSKVFQWLSSSLTTGFWRQMDRLERNYTNDLLRSGGEPHDLIRQLITASDAGITGLRLERKEVQTDDLKTHPIVRKWVEDIESTHAQSAKFHQDRVSLGHRAKNGGTIYLDLVSEESLGTQSMLRLSGYIAFALTNGLPLIVDELEDSLHPILVRNILALFLSAKTNPRGSQLLFTTHTPILLDTELLRRDQVWFTGKTDEGATILYPLTDYKPRNDEALAKAYLAGSYGGVPFIPNGLVP
jgi:hypothetical protein